MEDQVEDQVEDRQKEVYIVYASRNSHPDDSRGYIVGWHSSMQEAFKIADRHHRRCRSQYSVRVLQPTRSGSVMADSDSSVNMPTLANCFDIKLSLEKSAAPEAAAGAQESPAAAVKNTESVTEPIEGT